MEGSRGREGICGRVVAEAEGWYAGDRGRERRWGLDAGEFFPAGYLREGEEVLRREGEGG